MESETSKHTHTSEPSNASYTTGLAIGAAALTAFGIFKGQGYSASFSRWQIGGGGFGIYNGTRNSGKPRRVEAIDYNATTF
jgi:hypothetical protein